MSTEATTAKSVTVLRKVWFGNNKKQVITANLPARALPEIGSALAFGLRIRVFEISAVGVTTPTAGFFSDNSQPSVAVFYCPLAPNPS